jgi:hypothetical protein
MKTLLQGNTEITITDTHEDLLNLASLLRTMISNNSITVLGFDTEFISNKQQRLCTIQLGTNSFCYIFRVAVGINDYPIPNDLKSVLQNEGVVKVGLGMSQDIIMLNSRGTTMSNFIDVHSLCIILGIGKLSMNSLCEKMIVTAKKLGYTLISTGYKIDTGIESYKINWSEPTDNQLRYAGNDCLINLDLNNILLYHHKWTSSSFGDPEVTTQSIQVNQPIQRHSYALPMLVENKDRTKQVTIMEQEPTVYISQKGTNQQYTVAPSSQANTLDIGTYLNQSNISNFCSWFSNYLLQQKNHSGKLERMKNYCINAYGAWSKLPLEVRKVLFDKSIDILKAGDKLNVLAGVISIATPEPPITTYTLENKVYSYMTVNQRIISIYELSNAMGASVEELELVLISLRNKTLVSISLDRIHVELVKR